MTYEDYSTLDDLLSEIAQYNGNKIPRFTCKSQSVPGCFTVR